MREQYPQLAYTSNWYIYFVNKSCGIRHIHSVCFLDIRRGSIFSTSNTTRSFQHQVVCNGLLTYGYKQPIVCTLLCHCPILSLMHTTTCMRTSKVIDELHLSCVLSNLHHHNGNTRMGLHTQHEFQQYIHIHTYMCQCIDMSVAI